MLQGMQQAGSLSREVGFECVLISNDLLVCFATFLALISFLLASLVLFSSQAFRSVSPVGWNPVDPQHWLKR